MEMVLKFILGLVVMLLAAAGAAWLGWKFLKRSHDPGSLVVKWIVTAVGFIFLAVVVSQLGMFAPLIAAVVGVALGIMWAPSLAAIVAKPLTSFYDGGDVEPEERPFYSIARAKIKQGKYQESILEIHKQLERFSEDYEGWMLMAEVYGDHLKDNSGAQSCVEELLRHKGGHNEKNIAFALNRSADWHLALAASRESARQSLERIARLYPDSEYAHNAAQRIAHLTSDKMLADQRERPRIALARHDAHIGLGGELAQPREKIADPAARASELVEHLNHYPQDAEAREELARIYAEHYARLELASDQLEQLISTPGASQKHVTHYLNTLADFHLRHGGTRQAAEASLRRVMDLFPNTAAAANAEKRLAYIEIELKRNEKSQVVQLGSYEDNLGLKGNIPRKPE
jgi:outer membrane protein assembly factor BamD (BamD/ComL family)